jgi:hypothetical protein
LKIKIKQPIHNRFNSFNKALEQLGYTKITKQKQRVYLNKAYDSVIVISEINTPDTMVINGELAAQAFLMKMKGIVEHCDDIPKWIEQMRMKSQTASLAFAA